MNWLLHGALLVMRFAAGAAAGWSWFDLLHWHIEDQAIGALLLVEDQADHGTRTQAFRLKYVSEFPPL